MAKTSAIWRMLLTADYQVKPDESLRPAVFLDRDGTIIDETGYLADPGDITFYPGVPEALKRLRERGYTLVVITNQSGIGRGFFDEETALAVNLAMLRMLGEKGVDLDAIYYCPHHPEDNCFCRKPDLRMVQRALNDLAIDLSHSWVVGDIDKDVQTAIKAGLRPILVETGKVVKGSISKDVKRCETFAEAASFILEEGLK
jgi:histidinol-phosphate phosphatase family protein